MATKLNTAQKENIVAMYAKANVADAPKAGNAKFFAEVRALEDYAGVADAQIRGILVQAGTYIPHNPRQPAKKAGLKKEDLVEKLAELVGQELASANKLTMSDLEAIIAKLEG